MRFALSFLFLGLPSCVLSGSGGRRERVRQRQLPVSREGGGAGSRIKGEPTGSLQTGREKKLFGGLEDIKEKGGRKKDGKKSVLPRGLFFPPCFSFRFEDVYEVLLGAGDGVVYALFAFQWRMAGACCDYLSRRK